MNFTEALEMGSACLAIGETSRTDRDERTL
jgi:hypothetical protein